MERQQSLLSGMKTTGTSYCLKNLTSMPCHEGLNQAAFDNAMVACLADKMHINE